MEFKKLSELYSFKDTFENGWAITGGVTLEIDRHLTIYFDLLEDDIKIGSLNYTKPFNKNAAISYSIPEDDRNDFVGYANNLLNSILTNFKGIENN